MTANLYEQLITEIRKTYPILSIKNIIKNLEKTIEEFGIKIYHSDMTHIKSPRKIEAYSCVDRDRPIIIINSFLSKPKRRFLIAKHVGYILLHWKWVPNKNLSDDLVEISFHNQINIDIKENQAIKFAFEFLSPIKHVNNFLKNKKNIPQDKNFQIALIADHYKIPILQSKHQWNLINTTKNKKINQTIIKDEWIFNILIELIDQIETTFNVNVTNLFIKHLRDAMIEHHNHHEPNISKIERELFQNIIEQNLNDIQFYLYENVSTFDQINHNIKTKTTIYFRINNNQK